MDGECGVVGGLFVFAWFGCEEGEGAGGDGGACGDDAGDCEDADHEVVVAAKAVVGEGEDDDGSGDCAGDEGGAFGDFEPEEIAGEGADDEAVDEGGADGEGDGTGSKEVIVDLPADPYPGDE